MGPEVLIAVAAGSRDPRFLRVWACELDELEYTVEVQLALALLEGNIDARKPYIFQPFEVDRHF